MSKMKELKCFYKCQTTSLDHLNICLTQYVLWPTRSPFRFTLAERDWKYAIPSII